MNYQNKVKTHLAEYKENVMGVKAKGLHKRTKKLYKHILPEGSNKLNILEPYRESFYSSVHSKNKFHDGFHPLNSSQALCFNLFYPLIVENRLDLFLDLIGMKNNLIKEVQFEFVSDLENARHKTNFDFFVELADGARIYVEVKYTEDEFKILSINDTYLSKFEKTYQPMLNENLFIHDEYKTPIAFLKNYQIMRNLVHINSRDYVVFLYPKENRKIHAQATLAFNEMLTDEGRERLSLLTLKKSVEYIADNVNEDRSQNHYDLFKHKYLV